MHNSFTERLGASLGSRHGQAAPLRLAAVLLCSIAAGCAALTNPTADGLPVRHVPPELLAESRAGEETIPLSLLRQNQPEVYQLAPGDLLGIWIETILGEKDKPPPIGYPVRALPPERADTPPAVGATISVREDGAVHLPEVDPVRVEGLTVAQAEKAIREAYVVPKKLKAGTERILVSLFRPRVVRVLVFRHDTGLSSLTGNTNVNFVASTVGLSGAGDELIGRSPTGTGYAVDLPGYDNDLLTALAFTGGFPSSNAVDEVVIYRNYFKGEPDKAAVLQELEAHRRKCKHLWVDALDGRTVRIPLRLRPGEVPSIRPEDIVLHPGDAVFVEAHELETFYTAGLLPPGEHVLPRDYDLDVVQAIARVKGPMVNGAFAQSNLNGFIIPFGIGNPNPSLLTVLRRTPGGGQVPIRVDLNRALRDSRERILVQAGDVLVLQETPGEAFARYFKDQFQFRFIGQIIQGRKTPGTITVTTP